MLALATGYARSPSIQIGRHAVELRDRGYTVVPDAGLSEDLVADAKQALADEFEQLHSGLLELGLDPEADSYAYEEIDKRHRFRWALRPSQPSAWTLLMDEAIGVASEVIEAAQTLEPHPDDSYLLPSALGWTRHLQPARPAVEAVGAIVSRKGAAAQVFHADSGASLHKLARLSPRHRLYNAFVPLVDLDEGGDGTMLLPGSHLERTRGADYAAAVARTASGRLEDDAVAMARMEVPACPAGGLLVWDFRVLHRGQPSRGRERAYAHAVLGTGGARDGLESRRLPRLADALAALPDEPAARQAAREAAVRAQRQTWLETRAKSTA